MTPPTGTSSCADCGAPLARDRRRRYCDDCRADLRSLPRELRPHVVDFSKAERAKSCQCPRPLIYADDGDHYCATCGRTPLPPPHQMIAAA